MLKSFPIAWIKDYRRLRAGYGLCKDQLPSVRGVQSVCRAAICGVGYGQPKHSGSGKIV